MFAKKFAMGVVAILAVAALVRWFWLDPEARPDWRLNSAPLNPSDGSSSNSSWMPDSTFVGRNEPQRNDPHALDPALDLARMVLAHIEREVQDYSATLVKRERINGSLSSESKMEIKVRTRKSSDGKLVQPLCVYLKFTDPWLTRGREVIWSETQGGGKLIAHEGGFKNVASLTLNPNDRLAMLGNKYPITEIGIARLVEKLIEKGERDKLAGPCEVQWLENQRVGDRNCQMIQVTHANPDPKFDFHIAQIYIDRERLIPLRYRAYMWPARAGAEPPLEEEYTYLNLKLNVGLVDADFDPKNPDYNFP